MDNIHQDEQSFKYEKVFPILKYGDSSNYIIKTADGKEQALPKENTPIIYSTGIDNLSIVFGKDLETHYEWLQHKDIENEVEFDIKSLLNISYKNLFKAIESSIQITKLTDGVGMLTGCKRLESSLFYMNSIWELIIKEMGFEDSVFGMPTQDVLIFVDINKSDLVKGVKQQVESIYNNPEHQKKISSNLYLRKVDGSMELYNL